MNCFFCSQEIIGPKIHIRDECPACGRDLHICLNCEFYDAGAYRQCRESVREPVQDKERANYCDFFRVAKRGATGTGSENDTLKKLNDLFKQLLVTGREKALNEAGFFTKQYAAGITGPHI